MCVCVGGGAFFITVLTELKYSIHAIFGFFFINKFLSDCLILVRFWFRENRFQVHLALHMLITLKAKILVTGDIIIDPCIYSHHLPSLHIFLGHNKSSSPYHLERLRHRDSQR